MLTTAGNRNTRINAAYEADTAGTKLNLSLHGFREDNGRIFIPPTVRYVEKQMRNENILANEALPIWGDERFLQSALKFAYGEDTAHLKKRNVGGHLPTLLLHKAD
jgi:aspartate aminotransferase